MADLKALPLDQSISQVLASSTHAGSTGTKETTVTLRSTWTVDQATTFLRQPQIGPEQQILYFYILEEPTSDTGGGGTAGGKLVGIISARKLLLSPGTAKLSDIMDRSLVTLRDTDTLFDACEVFAMHRLLAIPVVDAAGSFLGVLDISVYTDEVFDLAERKSSDEMFQLLGLHLEQLRNANAFAGFRMRMPWLLANIAGGLACALIGSLFSEALERVLLLSLFIPIMLTLCESIAMQSMTLSLQRLVVGASARRAILKTLPKEWVTALLLGLSSGLLVMLLSFLWASPAGIPTIIGLTIAANMLLAATIGLLIPVFVSRLKLNPSVAAGPIALALTDIAAMTLYLGAMAAAIR